MATPAIGDLVDRLFPEPEQPPAGRWVVIGDDTIWVPADD